jgi:hypothetical protein
MTRSPTVLPPFDVIGWPSIAQAAGLTEADARAHARREDDRLPVQLHLGDMRGRRAELTAWKVRQDALGAAFPRRRAST